MKVALITDNNEERHTLKEALESAEIRVLEVAECSDGLQQALDQAPGLAIVDEGMPSTGGSSLLPVLRGVTNCPIIVIGAGQEAAMVRALLQGADVYLTRPVNIREVLVRSRALLRRHEVEVQAAREEQHTLDRVQLGRILSGLSQTEAHLFRYLLERAGRLVGREELLAGVWGASGKNTSLRFYISRLRCKLGRLAQATSIEILNRKGMGYLLKVCSDDALKSTGGKGSGGRLVRSQGQTAKRNLLD